MYNIPCLTYFVHVHVAMGMLKKCISNQQLQAILAKLASELVSGTPNPKEYCRRVQFEGGAMHVL